MSNSEDDVVARAELLQRDVERREIGAGARELRGHVLDVRNGVTDGQRGEVDVVAAGHARGDHDVDPHLTRLEGHRDGTGLDGSRRRGVDERAR